MERMINSKSEKESIYEIYRACRLCGGGAGYKMPIIQDIVDLEEADVELKQKIRECVQIEVHQDDKMPPLICELCVDKVNDFYEFLDMCRQTNKKTRLRLGLPPQSMPKGAPDAGDCILGVTEPVYANDRSDGEPQPKQKKQAQKTKIKVEKEKEEKEKVLKRDPVVRIKKENLQEERKKSRSKREPTPPRITRHRSKEEDVVLVSLDSPKEKPTPPKTAPKSILKKGPNIKIDKEKPKVQPPSLKEKPKVEPPSLKRLRDKEPVKPEVPAKKVKITTKSSPAQKPLISPASKSNTPSALKQQTSPAPKTQIPPAAKPKSLKSSPRLLPQKPPVPPQKPSRPVRAPPPPPPPKAPSPPRETFPCAVCNNINKSVQARVSHMRVHGVTFTDVKLACNPCKEWFSSVEETASHHKRHKSRNIPYSCSECQADFKHMTDYDVHFINNECLPSMEVPDYKCIVCWNYFATNNLLDAHRCLGEEYRPGGKCSKCKRNYALLKNLIKHESSCTVKGKDDFQVDKVLLGKLKPIQVRVARCDPLLTRGRHARYDVSCVPSEYGLDRNCYYPYISKFSGMVNIHDEIKKVFCSEDYVHWDSEESDSDITCDIILNSEFRKKKVDTLATLSLKTIFSKRLLGKVPRKKRKIKIEKAFDSLLGADQVRINIDNIIDNLSDNDDGKHYGNRSDCSYDILTNLSQDVSMLSNDSVENNDNCSLNEVNDKVDGTDEGNKLSIDSLLMENDDDSSKNIPNSNETKNVINGSLDLENNVEISENKTTGNIDDKTDNTDGISLNSQGSNITIFNDNDNTKSLTEINSDSTSDSLITKENTNSKTEFKNEILDANISDNVTKVLPSEVSDTNGDIPTSTDTSHSKRNNNESKNENIDFYLTNKVQNNDKASLEDINKGIDANDKVDNNDINNDNSHKIPLQNILENNLGTIEGFNFES